MKSKMAGRRLGLLAGVWSSFASLPSCQNFKADRRCQQLATRKKSAEEEFELSVSHLCLKVYLCIDVARATGDGRQVKDYAHLLVEREDCDPDKLLQCPFDKNHQIRASRFPYHLIKCKKNHPQLASELKTCPFNARHLIPKHELTHHTATCVDRRSVNTDDWGNTEAQYKWQVPVSTWTNANTSEDWDKEADDGATPFVWGVSTCFNQKSEARTTNNLNPRFRVPNTLPWAVSRP